MNFTVPQKPLAIALATTATAASSKTSTMPILGNVLLTATIGGTLLVSATDLELGYSTAVENLQWENEPLRDLAICVPAKKLAELVKSIPTSDVKFSYSIESQRLGLSGGTVNYSLAGLDPLDYPTIPRVEGEQFDLDAAALVGIIKAVAYAQSKDELKYNLCGINLKIEPNLEDDLFLTAASTDGHRLVLDTASLPGDPRPVPANLAKSVIIGSKGVAALGKISTSGVVCLNIAGNHLQVTTPDEIISIRLVDGTFPDIDRVIPKTFSSEVEVKRLALLEALDRCRLLANGDSKRATLSIGDGDINIRTENTALGSACDKVTAPLTGDPLAVAVNTDYLIDALDHMDSGLVKIQFSAGEYGPMLITKLGTDFPMAIVMPQRL